jgi:hypothetical protein
LTKRGDDTSVHVGGHQGRLPVTEQGFQLRVGLRLRCALGGALHWGVVASSVIEQ